MYINNSQCRANRISRSECEDLLLFEASLLEELAKGEAAAESHGTLTLQELKQALSESSSSLE